MYIWGVHCAFLVSSCVLSRTHPPTGTSHTAHSDDDDKTLDTYCGHSISRVAGPLFASTKKVKPTTAFTIRVSYVEIYLEKILDLLHPQGLGGSIRIEEDK